MLTRLFDDPSKDGHFPRPFGVFYATQRICYEDLMAEQLAVSEKKKPANLDELLRGKEVWEIN